MFNFSKSSTVAAISMLMIAGAARADEGRTAPVVSADQADRTMTFAIPRHAMEAFVSTLGKNSDFSVFMDKDCPVELQQMALRRLWKLLPETTSENPAI